jgi:hypothetical protein
MSDEQCNRNTFVIPQRRAGKHFNKVISQRKIDGVSLETNGGTQLVDLPIQINVNKVVPRVFRLPMQAGVTATSVLARLFHVKITFGLKDNES